MTPEEQRIAIAKACGWCNILINTDDEWHFLSTRELQEMNGVGCAGRNCILFPDGHFHPLPDYINDLNAMHEAENTLNSEAHSRFREHVWAVTHSHDGREYLSATAAQRAEAFLRTIGEWKEDTSS